MALLDDVLSIPQGLEYGSGGVDPGDDFLPGPKAAVIVWRKNGIALGRQSKPIYPHDVADMALAYAIGDKVEAAYRRGDLFEKRSRLMAEWAKYCETLLKKGKVIPINRAL